MSKAISAQPLSGQMDGEAHVLPIRVYYEDTDSAGIVYYANYLRFAERGRTEMLRHIGGEHVALAQEAGLAFAVRHVTADYQRPARLDDALALRTRITRVGGASLEMEQRVERGGETLVEMVVKLVCMNQTGKAARLPDELRNQMLAVCEQKERG